MAKLNLLPRKCFEIVMEDGTIIAGQFGTYALALYQMALNKQPESDVFKATSILLAAVQQGEREKGIKNFGYEDFHACKWIDELGGMDSKDCTALFEHLTEKKNQGQSPADNPSALLTSNESQPAQG